jgi:hypothetical protein
MKKIYTVILFCSLFIITGCSKDFLKSYDRRIVGTWKITDVKRNGLGGSTDNLPFQAGTFSFNSDGTLTYLNAAGESFQGTWNIENKTYNDVYYQSLEITAINFTTQQVIGEYYDDMDFTGTDRFKTQINQGLHTYVTKFER